MSIREVGRRITVMYKGLYSLLFFTMLWSIVSILLVLMPGTSDNDWVLFIPYVMVLGATFLWLHVSLDIQDVVALFSYEKFYTLLCYPDFNIKWYPFIFHKFYMFSKQEQIELLVTLANHCVEIAKKRIYDKYGVKIEWGISKHDNGIIINFINVDAKIDINEYSLVGKLYGIVSVYTDNLRWFLNEYKTGGTPKLSIVVNYITADELYDTEELNSGM